MNTQRRIFRGRGGPTDGRLPKHNAGNRRAKRPNQARDARKYSDSDGNKIDVEDTQFRDTMVFEAGEDENTHQLEILLPPPEIQTDKTSSGDLHRETCLAETTDVAPKKDFADPTIITPLQKELKHLQRRIKNGRESMQLSQSLADPQKYEEIVLNAVANCVNEWRQIKNYYCENDVGSEREEELSEAKMKEVSLNVFQLVQHSVQCGPLHGGKPGYFKRCGSQVAKIVLGYLLRIVPNQEASQALGFSEKQVKTLESWKSNAEKAVANNQPPSKSQLKKQAEVGKKSKKCKKKKQ